MPHTAAHRRALNEAKRKERAAGKKVSRIEAQGVNVSGSRYDLRVGAKRLESMSTRELQHHARLLDAFVSRRTQFVAVFGGTPVPKAKWNEYVRLQTINNERAEQFISRYGAIRLPGQDQTIAGHIEATTPEQRVNNQGRVYEAIERKSWSITGEKQLDTLIAGLKRKTAGAYTDRTIRARLNSGEAALQNAGFEEFIGEVEQLTKAQQEVLIDGSSFFDIAVENMIKSPNKSEVSELLDANYLEHEGVEKSEEVGNALREQIEWVKSVVPRNPRDEKGRFISRDTFIENLIASYKDEPAAARNSSARAKRPAGKARRDNRRRP